MKNKVTSSLYNSYYWYKRLDKPDEEFIESLERADFDRTASMLNGIRFETDLELAMLGEKVDSASEKYLACIDEAKELIGQGKWQRYISGDLGFDFEGLPVHATGVIDIVRPDGVLIDVKYTGRYAIGKYQHQIQHDLYMAVTGAKDFEYVVCERGNDIFVESYSSTPTSRVTMKDRIYEMLRFIHAHDKFKQPYIENWRIQ